MTSKAQELLREALTLGPEERADVAAELLASLDEPEADADADVAWAAENRTPSPPSPGRRIRGRLLERGEAPSRRRPATAVTSRVRFELEADEEYRAAARWYETRRPGLGAEFLDAVDMTLRRVVRSPGAGAPVGRVPTGLGVRQVPVRRFPYHIVYLETVGAIRVLAVAHDRRRPRYWQDRL